MAKIGVYTFDFTLDNYGQVLQYLATQAFLNALGHHTTLLSMQGPYPSLSRRIKGLIKRAVLKLYHLFRPAKGGSPQKITDPEKEAKNALFAQWTACTHRQESEAPRHFEEFRQRYFSRQRGYYEELCNSGYDAYCVGSDQTWSFIDYNNMFGWTPEKAKRFTLAASLGHSHYSDNQIDTIKGYLHRFNFVTVREDNGLDFCKRAGYQQAYKVLDPTFLLQPAVYNQYTEEVITEKPYVFVYLLGGQISLTVREIINHCESLGYDVKYVESQGRDEDISKIPATVGQWLNLMSKATYVLTNSFHGFAFSLIYHKPMMVFPLVGIMKDMNGRITDLAKQMNLEERIYHGDFAPLTRQIDWSHIDFIIANNRDITTRLVQETLK